MKNKKTQTGVGLLQILLILVVLLSSAIGFNIYKSHEKKAELARQEILQKQEETRKAELIRRLSGQRSTVLAILNKWDDALKLAGITSRIALTQPLSQMQAIKREMEELKTNECLEKATKSATAGMNDAIFAFEMFIKFPNNTVASDATSKSLTNSTDKIQSAKQELEACVPKVE